MTVIPAPSRQLETADGPVDWAVSDGLVPYAEALAAMEARVAAIRAGTAPELIWLLQHPPLYTAGTSAKPQDLLDARFPVHATGRGGQYTYHGPGQRIAYVMLDLAKRGRDLRNFVCRMEDWVIDSLGQFGIRAERRPGRVGVWVSRPDKGPSQGAAGREDKIAAIGVRVRHWVTYHGLSLNVEPDLGHYSGIVPCGIHDDAATPFGVTSLVDLGLPVSLDDVDTILFSMLSGSLLERLGNNGCSVD